MIVKHQIYEFSLLHFPFIGFVIEEDIKAETMIKSEGATRISIVQVVITMTQGNKRSGISLGGRKIHVLIL